MSILKNVFISAGNKGGIIANTIGSIQFGLSTPNDLLPSTNNLADLILDGDDIETSNGLINSWNGIGSNFSPTGSHGTPTITMINDQQFAYFRKNNFDQLKADNDITQTVSERTMMIVYKPETGGQNVVGKREYLFAAGNNDVNTRLIFGHTANLTVIPYNKVGIYDNASGSVGSETWSNGWHIFEQLSLGSQYVHANNRLQVGCWTLSNTPGISSYWRNGNKLGICTHGLTNRAFFGGNGKMVIGGAENSAGTTSDTHFDGAIGYIVSWPFILTDDQIIEYSNYLKNKYNIIDLDYTLPNHFGEVNIWYDGGSNSSVSGSIWSDQRGLAPLTLINSPTIENGVPKWNGINQEGRIAASWGGINAIRSGSYHVMGVIEVNNVNTTSTNYLLNDLIWGSEDGYLRIIVRSGTSDYEMNVGHWDGSANVPTWSPIELNRKHLFSARYDGTTISFQIDDNMAQTVVANGDLLNLDGLIRMAGTSGADTLQLSGSVHALSVGIYVSGTAYDNIKSYLEDIRDS